MITSVVIINKQGKEYRIPIRGIPTIYGPPRSTMVGLPLMDILRSSQPMVEMKLRMGWLRVE
jgi:hypothetical protein